MSDSKTSMIINRVDDQIAWYDRKSLSAQRKYKTLKFTSLLLAALVPIVALFPGPVFFMGYHIDQRIAVALFGVGITICEGLQHMNQYQRLWIAYRSTCEALRHEKFAYVAGMGAYKDVADPAGVLSDRTESLMSSEQTKWRATQSHDSQIAKATP